MILETNDMLYSIRGYCKANNLPYHPICDYIRKHKELPPLQAIELWKKKKAKKIRREEFCTMYGISSKTYYNLGEEKIKEYAQEYKILYNNKYITVKEYCRQLNINYNTIYSIAHRKHLTPKQALEYWLSKIKF